MKAFQVAGNPSDASIAAERLGLTDAEGPYRDPPDHAGGPTGILECACPMGQSAHSRQCTRLYEARRPFPGENIHYLQRPRPAPGLTIH